MRRVRTHTRNFLFLTTLRSKPFDFSGLREKVEADVDENKPLNLQ